MELVRFGGERSCADAEQPHAPEILHCTRLRSWIDHVDILRVIDVNFARADPDDWTCHFLSALGLLTFIPIASIP